MSEAKVEKIKVSDNWCCLEGSTVTKQHIVCRKQHKKFLSAIPVLRADLHLRELIRLSSTQGSSFATGVEVQDKRKRVNIISTGSKSVDAIMGGNVALRLQLAFF